MAFALASLSMFLASCADHTPLAREKLALEQEWLPFWQNKNCGEVHKKFDTWRKANAGRIDPVETKWNALTEAQRDAATKKVPGFQDVWKTQIEITIMCGKGPRLSELPPKK